MVTWRALARFRVIRNQHGRSRVWPGVPMLCGWRLSQCSIPELRDRMYRRCPASLAGKEHGQQSFLCVQAILCLIEEHRPWPVRHLFTDLLPAVGR